VLGFPYTPTEIEYAPRVEREGLPLSDELQQAPNHRQLSWRFFLPLLNKGSSKIRKDQENSPDPSRNLQYFPPHQKKHNGLVFLDIR